MIHGLSKYSTNGAGAGIDYFLALEYFDRSEEEWRKRDPAPTLLEGKPSAMRTLCESLDFKHKYTSGVLSFSKDETSLINSKPGTKEKIIEEFKDFAFAGVKEDCRNILLVEHNHVGRIEIHYMIPRIHLESGKYFNPFPPNYGGRHGAGSNKEFISQNDSFIDHICKKYELQNPRSPEIQRSVTIPQFDPQRNIKKQVISAIDHLIDAGAISSREDMIRFLEKNGAVITRKGSNYFSLKFEGMSKAIKLEGELYSARPFSEIAKRHSERAERFETQRASAESRYGKTLDFRAAEVNSRHRIPKKITEQSAERDTNLSKELQKTQREISETRAIINSFSPSVINAARDFVGQNKSLINQAINTPKAPLRSIIAPNVSTGNKIHDELLQKFHSEMTDIIKKDITQRERLSDMYANLTSQATQRLETAIRQIASFSASLYTGIEFRSVGSLLNSEIGKFSRNIANLIKDINSEFKTIKLSQSNLEQNQKTVSSDANDACSEYSFGFATKTKITRRGSSHGKNSANQAKRDAENTLPNTASPSR